MPTIEINHPKEIISSLSINIFPIFFVKVPKNINITAIICTVRIIVIVIS